MALTCGTYRPGTASYRRTEPLRTLASPLAQEPSRSGPSGVWRTDLAPYQDMSPSPDLPPYLDMPPYPDMPLSPDLLPCLDLPSCRDSLACPDLSASPFQHA